MSRIKGEAFLSFFISFIMPTVKSPLRMDHEFRFAKPMRDMVGCRESVCHVKYFTIFFHGRKKEDARHMFDFFLETRSLTSEILDLLDDEAKEIKIEMATTEKITTDKLKAAFPLSIEVEAGAPTAVDSDLTRLFNNEVSCIAFVMNK